MQLELIDYTGALFNSHFMYIMPGDGYKPGAQYDMIVGKAPAGKARIVAVTVLPIAKVSETVARIFMGKSKDEFIRRYKAAFKMTDDMPVSILAFEWLHIETHTLKALMEIRFDGMKGLHKHERNQKLQLSLYDAG